ncbi:uncharacterized protein CTRU02_211645 [Colletotrichum truncatum]|uniref:Uncharacterized protein n=1 Tax=Colletotrichum truncatum TaxID=5467 RepID=A0ACC3YLG7_COLTU|nr:uncharacterized protein CTRU02_14633 [Colletotrichum truncatum]KAF6781952.1 hypothetical protein CTRU02_14633 [Colletotrichum truncatum]
MTTLLSLPRELLRCILSEVYRHTEPECFQLMPLFEVYTNSIPTLKSLSQTCRQLHQAVVPFLYRDISLERTTGPALIALLRYFEANPYSASCVRKIYINWNTLDKDAFVYSYDDTEFINGLAKSLGLSLPENWDVYEESTSILAGLVLLKASDVQTVDVKGYPASFYQSIPVRASHRLRSFKEFRSSVRPGDFRPEPMYDLCRLINLAPHLKVFHANNLLGMNEGDIDWSNITSLNLDDDQFGTKKIIRIIESCKRLEHLEFECGDESPAPVIVALEKHAESMKLLSFISYGDDPEADGLISLKAFQTLEGLTLNGLECVPGTILQTIPQSLNHLRIDGDFDHLQEDFQWLASKYLEGSFPNFERLRLEPMWTCGHDTCPFILDGKIRLDKMERLQDEGFSAEYEGSTCKTHWEIVLELVKAGIQVWVDQPVP